jgi:hypothetical protein
MSRRQQIRCEALPVQAELLCALRGAAGVSVVWPWDTLDELIGLEAPWPLIASTVACCGVPSDAIAPGVTVADLIDLLLSRETRDPSAALTV